MRLSEIQALGSIKGKKVGKQKKERKGHLCAEMIRTRSTAVHLNNLTSTEKSICV